MASPACEHHFSWLDVVEAEGSNGGPQVVCAHQDCNLTLTTAQLLQKSLKEFSRLDEEIDELKSSLRSEVESLKNSIWPDRWD